MTIWQRLLILLLLILSLGSLVYGAVTALRDSADLERRAEEVAMFRKGVDPYLDQEDMTYPPSAPPFFLLTVPPGAVPVRRLLWIGFNFLALVTVCVGILKGWGNQWPRWVQWAFVLVVASSKPVRGGMALGQFHLIPLAMMVLAEVFSSRVLIAGILIGLALIKPTMVVPYVVLMAIRGQWRALFVAASVQAVLFGATSWQLGKDPLFLTREWVRNAKAQSTQGTIDIPTLISEFRTDQVVDPLIISLLVLGLFAVIFVVFRRKSGLGLFAIATFSAAVFTYHRHYDLVLLLPALAYLIQSCTGSGRTRFVFPAVLMTIMMILPSSEKLLGDWESTYELFFKTSSYLFLTILLCRVASEPEASIRT